MTIYMIFHKRVAATTKISIIIFIAMLAALATSISAKEFIVGDSSGWTLNFDYQAWAEGKDFVIGDKLVFKYPVGENNVFEVNGTAFQQCIVPSLDKAVTSRNDEITLGTPGRK